MNPRALRSVAGAERGTELEVALAHSWRVRRQSTPSRHRAVTGWKRNYPRAAHHLWERADRVARASAGRVEAEVLLLSSMTCAPSSPSSIAQAIAPRKSARRARRSRSPLCIGVAVRSSTRLPTSPCARCRYRAVRGVRTWCASSRMTRSWPCTGMADRLSASYERYSTRTPVCAHACDHIARNAAGPTTSGCRASAASASAMKVFPSPTSSAMSAPPCVSSATRARATASRWWGRSVMLPNVPVHRREPRARDDARRGDGGGRVSGPSMQKRLEVCRAEPYARARIQHFVLARLAAGDARIPSVARERSDRARSPIREAREAARPPAEVDRRYPHARLSEGVEHAAATTGVKSVAIERANPPRDRRRSRSAVERNGRVAAR